MAAKEKNHDEPICYIHLTPLNDIGECDQCLAELTDNPDQIWDDINGEEYDGEY